MPGDPEASEAYRNKLLPRPAHHTKNQRQLVAYLSANGNHITTYTLIAEETGIPVGTIRDVLRKFEHAGLIRKSKHVQGGLQGLRLTLTEAFPAPGAPSVRASNASAQRSASTVEIRSLKERYSANPSVNAPEEGQARPLLPPEGEAARFRLLALTDEDLAFYYPSVARAGFGREQLGQVLTHLDRQGKSPERLFTALEHADFELAQGPLTDKDGQTVANPCGYLFNSLARTGYYRRPAGYVSAEEQASLDAEAEALAVKEVQERAGRAEFESWLAGLDQDGLALALEGCRGPREQWLRHYYETQVRRKG